MNYYKIIINNKIISIASDLNFRRYQKMYNLILSSTVAKAEFISALDGKFYYDRWLKPTDINAPLEIYPARIEKISEEDYKKLLQAFEKNEDIDNIVVEMPEDPIISEVDPIQDTIKSLKLEELRKSCSLAIRKGFSLIINFQEKIFPLEITDQLNISRLYQQAINGETFLPYHSQDGLCEVFSKDDIILLYKKMCEHINYHTTYHNALQDYVKSLSDEKISTIFYGIDIPEFYQTNVLKEMI